ncbi:hypothetical protein M0802_014721 [Mischocyttarus mexicanus]|nr:hypothetical protein M0802_014721 [Mischocyttarus mexicanus]
MDRRTNVKTALDFDFSHKPRSDPIGEEAIPLAKKRSYRARSDPIGQKPIPKPRSDHTLA